MESIEITAAQLCPICSKPFTAASSLKRHVLYCRRSQSRPNPRRRSCRNCNIAKAKCTFGSPCSRCDKKSITCVYNNTKAINTTSRTPEELDAADHMPTTDPTVEDSFDFVPWTDTSIPSFLQEKDDVSGSPFVMEVEQPAEVDQTLCLTRVGRKDALAEHDASRVIDALCAIPSQMVRRETFPCFIHPHWGRQLPESLTICVHLAQMYATRSPEVRPFMWRSILAEQTRIMQQLSTINPEDLLAAIQAHTVYMIMRIADGATQDLVWNWEMTRASRILCDRFFEMCGGQFCADERSNPSFSWDEWVFAESRRRTSSIWFLISRTVVIMTRADCATTEQPWTLPLPSSKLLWEARDEQTWLQELGIGTPSISTFGDLVESKNRRAESDRAQSLDSWNATSDSLGFLLNLAVDMV